jgi:transposase
MGKNGARVFFDLGAGERVNSTIYQDQILIGSLQEFWEESFKDVQEPIIMEDNAPVHKKVCIPVRQELEMKCHQHPPNSPDLNPIENIWAHIKHQISKEYSHINP